MRYRALCDCLDRRQRYHRKGDVVEFGDPSDVPRWFEPVKGDSGAVHAMAPEDSLSKLSPVEDSDGLDLDELTKKDLVHVGGTRYGLDLSMRMSKEEMVQAIEEAKDRGA